MNAAKAVETTNVERTSDREIVFTRTLRARPRIVFDALTKAELIRWWWAPRSLGVVLYECESDARVGGAYRFVFGKEGQPRMAFSGVYKELEPGERVVMTQIFEPMRDAGEVVVTISLEATPDGFTRLVQRALYPSKQILDATMATGMEKGARESFDQLATVVTEL